MAQRSKQLELMFREKDVVHRIPEEAEQELVLVLSELLLGVFNQTETEIGDDNESEDQK